MLMVFLINNTPVGNGVGRALELCTREHHTAFTRLNNISPMCAYTEFLNGDHKKPDLIISKSISNPISVAEAEQSNHETAHRKNRGPRHLLCPIKPKILRSITRKGRKSIPGTQSDMIVCEAEGHNNS